ncbi:hypothetical protein [Nitrosopumilus sp.]|nr:hypothetical protein [Nitrosopumilus sp.]
MSVLQKTSVHTSTKYYDMFDAMEQCHLVKYDDPNSILLGACK